MVVGGAAEAVCSLWRGQGEGSCINVNVKGAAVYRAKKYRPELWDQVPQHVLLLYTIIHQGHLYMFQSHDSL